LVQAKERNPFRKGIDSALAHPVRVLAVVLAALMAPAASPAWAAHHMRHFLPTDPGAIGESIVIDADTGQVLSETNAGVATHPASLTKMMTLYLTFEALNTGKLRLDQYLPVSGEAAIQAPTKLGLTPGDAVEVHELILGLVTKSANDAAVVLAEGLAGSESAFAERMTQKARQLGLLHTTYRNASGLPDPEQMTTARDVAQLALALYHDFPREYRYFSTREFNFRGKIVTNHNHLLEWYDGADGIKTGYIRTSGFNLAASAVRNGHRLIGVVMGGRSARSRDEEMAELLDRGFEGIGVGPMLVAHREMPAAPPLAAAEAAGDAEPVAPATRGEKPGAIAKVAARLAAHLAPVAKAEAATLAHDSHPSPPEERWSIQLGAFHDETAAEKVAQEAASQPLAKGKPLRIAPPAKGEKDRLYRARLLNFTSKEAREVCAALHKKRIECATVPPAG
jgi:D-alanyl-D-alanine carboxypeptidase